MLVVENPRNTVCIEKVIVLDIILINYRTAHVLTDNGTIKLNQPRGLKDGSNVCVKYGTEAP